MRRALWVVFLPALAAAQPMSDPIAEYNAKCSANADSFECEILYGRVRSAMILALDDLVFSKDVRSIEAGIAALAVDDAGVQRAALRVLRRFPRRPEVAPAALPFLLGDHPVLRRAAAEILDKSGGDLARLGHQWLEAHPAPSTPDPSITAWDVDPVPDLAKLGFRPYAGWTRYPVADGKGALGYSTADPVAAVVAFYEKQTGNASVDAQGFAAIKSGKASGDAMRVDAQEMQRLMMEYQKTHDPAIIEKVKNMSKAMQGRASQATAAAQAGPVSLAAPPNEATLRIVVAEKRGDAAVKAVYVYREEAIGRTVVELVWNATTP